MSALDPEERFPSFIRNDARTPQYHSTPVNSADWSRRAAAILPGGTSTGSKRPHALYGEDHADLPAHYVRASGCRLIAADGRELIDCTMALGAAALGYADPHVTEAVERAVRDGNVSGLAPTLEVEVAERLSALVPCAERVRFLKTGAEGVAAAVRVARAYTQRDVVIGCGYFGWLDWCSDASGVPGGVRRDYHTIPFDDQVALEEAVAETGDALAAIVLEPVIGHEPDPEWLRAAREACDRLGAVLVFDEVKTGFRLDAGGYQRRVRIAPDLAVLGKALANGFPLAALVGRARPMSELGRTWVSSTLAAETTALAAARAVIERHDRENVCAALARHGAAMRTAVERAIARVGIEGVRTEGVPEMWWVQFPAEEDATAFVRGGVAEGVLFKRGAYNFASLAHRSPEVEVIERAAGRSLTRIAEARA